MKVKHSILLTRTDKLGDVILSLSAVDLVRRSLPDARISFLCRPEVADAIGPFLRERAIEATTADRLARQVFTAALSFYDEPALLQREDFRKAPIRVGPYTRWLSRFSLTKGIRQHRSLAKKSEAEYNLDLAQLFLQQLGVPAAELPRKLSIPVGEEERELALKELRRLELNEGFILLHPGMAGSALNFNAETYRELYQRLRDRSELPWLAVEGPSVEDRKLVSELSALIPSLKVVRGLSLGVYREVLRLAQLVIAPSTGPLHLAHWVGAPTLAIFSPVRTHRFSRWAPYGGIGSSWVFTPQVACKAKKDCLGRACESFYCLDGRGMTDWLEGLGSGILRQPEPDLVRFPK